MSHKLTTMQSNDWSVLPGSLRKRYSKHTSDVGRTKKWQLTSCSAVAEKTTMLQWPRPSLCQMLLSPVNPNQISSLRRTHQQMDHNSNNPVDNSNSQVTITLQKTTTRMTKEMKQDQEATVEASPELIEDTTFESQPSPHITRGLCNYQLEI